MTTTLINIASWEERFKAVALQQLSEGGVTRVVTIASARFQEKTHANRKEVRKKADEMGADYNEWIFDFDEPIECFRSVRRVVNDTLQPGDNVKFDISTARRDLLWHILSFVSRFSKEVELLYCTGSSYGGWQTDEEGEPRLVLNRSGIMFPDIPTYLIVMCGPEISRAVKLYDRFEPRCTLILRDINASAFGELKSFPDTSRGDIRELPFDHKDVSDQNLASLQAIIDPVVPHFNVICASFGPKMGAALLHRLTQNVPSVGLAYVPSRTYNFSHCRGVGALVHVDLSLAPSN